MTYLKVIDDILKENEHCSFWVVNIMGQWGPDCTAYEVPAAYSVSQYIYPTREDMINRIKEVYEDDFIVEDHISSITVTKPSIKFSTVFWPYNRSLKLDV